MECDVPRARMKKCMKKNVDRETRVITKTNQIGMDGSYAGSAPKTTMMNLVCLLVTSFQR